MVALIFMMVFICIFCLSYISTRILHVNFHNFMVIRKANKYGTPDLCCCGSMLEDHGWADNHAFVSEMEYFIESNTKKF